MISHLLWTEPFINLHVFGIKRFAHLGPLGVRIFFVISGFLITSLLLKELDTKKHINLRKFYFRRTLRIFPAYYFFLLVVIILQEIGCLQLAPGDVLHALTYTVNYHSERSWYIGHSWSLSVEEQFYLLWPTVLLFAGKHRGLWIASSFIILCPVIRLGIWYLFPWLVKYEIGYRFETVADSIAIGCILASAQRWLISQKIYHNILRSKVFFIVPIVVLYASSLHESSRLSLFFGMTLQNVGIAACIAWCITNHSGKIGKVLNSKPIVFLGVISYSVYLWQQLFLVHNSKSIISQFPISLILIGLASLISYYGIERPFLRIRQNLEDKIFVRTTSSTIHQTDYDRTPYYGQFNQLPEKVEIEPKL
jgi:peptidoglycan/LPS O-acetylase OafA/YrhL